MLVVRVLVEVGVEVVDMKNARDDGWTPLHIAAQRGYGAIRRLLTDAGAV